MSNLALQNQAEMTLTVLSGVDKGTVYRLQGHKITLGRGSDNDVIIPEDPKVSRHHAKISVTPKGVMITNLSDRNVMKVNGDEFKAKVLVENCVIQLGETQFRFQFSGGALAPVGGGMESPGSPLSLVGQMRNAAQPKSSRKGGRGKQQSPMIYIILGVLGLMAFLFLGGTGKKVVDEGLRTEEQMQTDTDSVEEANRKADDERQKSGKTSSEYIQAQSFYVRGFRDYNVGQYERAMESLQACLSLYPQHSLCQRYYRLSQKKFGELVQYHMILGRKYKDQNQFKACASSFRNVMTMLKDTSNATYKEAAANFKSCSGSTEDRY